MMPIEKRPRVSWSIPCCNEEAVQRTTITGVATASLFGGVGSIDLNGNPKVFPREVLDPMNLRSTDSSLDAEVMSPAKHLGMEVLESAVLAQARDGGTSHVPAAACWEFAGNPFSFRLGARPRPPAPIGANEPEAGASRRI